MKDERETSLKKQTMSGTWATPLNPKTGNFFEYVMWAILISLKYRKWQYELNWWMAIKFSSELLFWYGVCHF